MDSHMINNSCKECGHAYCMNCSTAVDYKEFCSEDCEDIHEIYEEKKSKSVKKLFKELEK